ncbi:MAG: hypothetical protein ACRDH9_02600 [Actinomycetota bacterium]
MRRPRIAMGLVILAALILSGAASSASGQPQSDRLYLMSADTDYLYWTADASDPELAVGSISRMCGTNYVVPTQARPCLIGNLTDPNTRNFNLYFLPASTLDEKVTWSGSAPLRFHMEGTVNTFGVPYTVQLVLQKPAALIVSDAATQTAPGVWEGQLTSGAPLNTADVNNIGVRVTTQAPVALIDLRLGGRSYVQLQRPFAVHGVPDLLREDTYSPQPTTYSTATRSFAFNDANWETRSFSGDTTAPKTIDFSTTQKSEVLIAWIELYESGTIQDVKHARQPDQEKAAQGIGLLLSRDGTVIDHSGGNGAGVVGSGTAAVSALDLSSGPLSLVIDPASDGADRAMPYTVHVLEVRGDRTLRAMHWLFHGATAARTPAVASCPVNNQPVPATDKVKSIDLDLDWDAATPLSDWTFRFDMPYGIYPCSEAGTGDQLRLTLPSAERIFWVGATPAYHSDFVSAYDTTFEITARFTYSPPPAA